jgi:uncharacterized RDD family membrane protein YckC
MSWYYEDEGRRVGPVSDAQFEELLSQGKVTTQTLVWHERLEKWTPYGQVQGGPTGAVGPAPRETDPQNAVPEAVCAECGNLFSREEVIRYEGSWVCATCKPGFLQKLREGAVVSHSLEYGGFWLRFAAKLIDGLILGVVQMVSGFFFARAMVPTLTSGEAGAGTVAVVGAMYASQFVFALAYTTWFLGRFGATPGKMACSLRVVTAEGAPISYGLGCGRFFAEIVSAIILYIGYLMAAFNDEKAALHDRICGTRVVKKR